MFGVQSFALDNIYCSPSLDNQFRFKMIRVTKSSPAKEQFTVYDTFRYLPDRTNLYHVYIIGNLPNRIVNLMIKYRDWVRDTWVNVEEDMTKRDYIFQIYNDIGITLPRKNIWYSTSKNNELVIAVKIDRDLRRLFDVDSFKYVRVYSNYNYRSGYTQGDDGEGGIYCSSVLAYNFNDITTIRNKAIALEAGSGKVFRYINGMYAEDIPVNTPLDSIIEIVYDASVISKEIYTISELRTFISNVNSRMKYFLFRDKLIDGIQYEDDIEIYIINSVGSTIPYPLGLYYYQNKAQALTNVTDKDFALDSIYVNNQVSQLFDIVNFPITEAKLVVYTRDSKENINLVYSSAKLHELYKLPNDIQLDVLTNTIATIPEFRVENIENSSYLQLMNLPTANAITSIIATDALGYNGINYYFANTPLEVDQDLNVEVSSLFSYPSTALEFDSNGLLINIEDTFGPTYAATNPNTTTVDFRYGRRMTEMYLYSAGQTVSLKSNLSEYRVVKANYINNIRINDWEDITGDSLFYTVNNGTLTFVSGNLEYFRIIYLDDIIYKNINVDMSFGYLVFNLGIQDDRDGVMSEKILDVPYDTLEVYMNGRRLVQDIDYILNFPYVNICNKSYINYSNVNQKVEYILSGFNLKETDINKRDLTGFVNNGVLTRNNRYDVRDDKVFCCYVNGKLIPRGSLDYAEDNSTVNINDSNNGKPYLLMEPPISIRPLTGLDTLDYKVQSEELNTKISNLFDNIFPEPVMDPFNVIGDHHYLYSPTVSKIIVDLLNGTIPSSLYNNLYSDGDVMDILHNNYEDYIAVDPATRNLPNNVVEIHPHLGNTSIAVSIQQYQFITRVIKLITNDNPSKINISGYLSIV